MKRQIKWSRLILIVILGFIGLLMVYPIIWMLFSSVKSVDDIFAHPLEIWPRAFHFENFTNALADAPFLSYLWNSLWTTTVIVALQLFLSSLLAYALTQWRFFGSKALFTVILTTYMLPSATTYIPSYIILGNLNLTNSLIGLVVSNLANVFMIFLLRQNFLMVPKSVIEAARADGASEWAILWHIVFPLSRNSILNATLISFITNFNGYLWPSLLLNDEQKLVISVGLNRFSTTQGAFDKTFPIVMAGTTLSVVPLILLYLVLQRYFIRGVAAASTKG